MISSLERSHLHFLYVICPFKVPHNVGEWIWPMNLRYWAGNCEKLKYYRLLTISVWSNIWVIFNASVVIGHELFLRHAFVKTCLVTMVSIDFWWPLRVKTTHPSERSASYHLCVWKYPHITPHKCILQLQILEGKWMNTKLYSAILSLLQTLTIQLLVQPMLKPFCLTQQK